MQVTVKEFGDKFGINNIEANSVLKFLEKRNVASVIDHRKPVSGKGRSSSVYQINLDIINKDLFNVD